MSIKKPKKYKRLSINKNPLVINNLKTKISCFNDLPKKLGNSLL